MRVLHYGKDGGKESTVWGFFLVELKSLFSIVLLRFENGSREAYHSHAFDAISWVLKGTLREQRLYQSTDGAVGMAGSSQIYRPSLVPIFTGRDNLHKVNSVGRTWVFTLRGPWANTWTELVNGRIVTLSNGRREVA